jgi:hypothetical protein
MYPCEYSEYPCEFLRVPGCTPVSTQSAPVSSFAYLDVLAEQEREVAREQRLVLDVLQLGQRHHHAGVADLGQPQRKASSESDGYRWLPRSARTHAYTHTNARRDARAHEETCRYIRTESSTSS